LSGQKLSWLTNGPGSGKFDESCRKCRLVRDWVMDCECANNEGYFGRPATFDFRTHCRSQSFGDLFCMLRKTKEDLGFDGTEGDEA
jgi:hypothetical protein